MAMKLNKAKSGRNDRSGHQCCGDDVSDLAEVVMSRLETQDLKIEIQNGRIAAQDKQIVAQDEVIARLETEGQAACASLRRASAEIVAALRRLENAFTRDGDG